MNKDKEERQKPCAYCFQPIGAAFMTIEAGLLYHTKCIKTKRAMARKRMLQGGA